MATVQSCMKSAESLSWAPSKNGCCSYPIVPHIHLKNSKRQTRCRAAFDGSLPADRDPAVNSGLQDAQGAAVSVELPTAAGAAESLEEYSQLKKDLFKRAQRAGGFLALYLFLQQGITAAACSAVATGAGCLYLRLLVNDAEKYSAASEVPLVRALKVTNQPIRALAIGAAAYRQALRPRLLVPIALGVAVGANNRFSDQPLSYLHEFDMLLGFLCYKAGLLLKLYDDIKPKFNPELLTRPARPTLPDIQDIGEEKKEKALRERKRH